MKRGSWSFLDFAWVSGAGNLDVKFNERLSGSPGMENMLVGEEEADHSKYTHFWRTSIAVGRASVQGRSKPLPEPGH